MPAQKVPIEFGEWRPDIALLDNKFASVAENVFPGVNSYKPFPGLQAFGVTQLAGRVCGLTSARMMNGTWKIYAGTTTGLFSWDQSGWTDVSRTVGGAYNCPSDALWSFSQFGTNLVAVNINDAPQVIDIEAGTHFAALGGSPPHATTVYTIGDFLVLSGLSPNTRQIQWSAINNITAWTVGTNLSDMQEMPDGGPVQGVTGGEIGYVVQDRCIRTMQFLPGDTTFIFSFSRVLHDRGCISKYGYVSIGNVLYFVAEDGFYNIAGQQVNPIGADKVNDWFLANSDRDRRNVIQAFTFINKPRIAWAFHASSASPVYDRLIIFDWSNGRWSYALEDAQVWATSSLASTDLDLDTTGPEPNDALLDVPEASFSPSGFQNNAFQVTASLGTPARSLDSFAYVGGRPLIGGVDEDGYIGALSGPNLRATVETAEAHLVPGLRAFVSDVYPFVDGAADIVTAGTRERLQDVVVWGQPVTVEITGSAALYSSARLHRFRVTMPPAETWNHAQGALVEVQQDGSVA